MGNTLSALFSSETRHNAITTSAIQNLNDKNKVKTSAVSTIGDNTAVVEATNKTAVSSKLNASAIKVQTGSSIRNEISETSATITLTFILLKNN